MFLAKLFYVVFRLGICL